MALKLDRITRSIFGWEKLMAFLVENEAYLDCVNGKINTTTANDKMISRSYQRTLTYLFLEKLTSPKCGRLIGGKATKIKNGNIYYLDC